MYMYNRLYNRTSRPPLKSFYHLMGSSLKKERWVAYFELDSLLL